MRKQHIKINIRSIVLITLVPYTNEYAGKGVSLTEDHYT